MTENGTVAQNEQTEKTDNIISLAGMYKDYFLDYASYVILERAVPAIEDGLKPVQRRILHAMKEMDDGRFHKVANVIGQTMQYHPHGDAAIGDALVNLGQKNLLIDCQGNWGDNRTGDRAAAARYIEARLTKFALDIAFNPKTTEWQLSYDGRKKEPITLPMKFPLLLAQGVEGIAVGLSTKIMPHNFRELIAAAIDHLSGEAVALYPDFESGGFVDVEHYNGGKRGGKIRVRAKIEQVDKKHLVIKELPYGVTTGSLIESIVKANDKGKIKIKRVIDNTAKDVEILIELGTNVSPALTIDALYAFSNCEVSISPNACVIIDDKPHFLTVNDILKTCTENTKKLLEWELKIQQAELAEKWHFASLEKIFIERRIYRKIEQSETWEEVLETIDKSLQRYTKRLKREVTREDIIRLTEIKIKRISKYNTFKAEEQIAALEQEMETVAHHLANLVDYTIAFYKNLLDKYGNGRERQTKITSFDIIEAAQVAANNAKLYVNRKEGFIGYGLRKDEYICDCSDIDDIIVFRKDGQYLVTRISDKTFVGKNIIHVAVWKKGDKRTTYNIAYSDGTTGRTFVKRFQVTAIKRHREYNMMTSHKYSKLLYFSANLNGESEIIKVQLTQQSSAKTKMFEYDYAELAIKGRTTRGNLLTKFPVRKISQLSVGKSTLGAQKVWMDAVSGRLNTEKRGKYLGAFDTGDKILVLYKDGTYETKSFDLTHRFGVKDLIDIARLDKAAVVSTVYYDSEKKATYVKRFQIETSTDDRRFNFMNGNDTAKCLYAALKPKPVIQYYTRVGSKKIAGELKIMEFVEVRGWKALGNQFSPQRLTGIVEVV